MKLDWNAARAGGRRKAMADAAAWDTGHTGEPSTKNTWRRNTRLKTSGGVEDPVSRHAALNRCSMSSDDLTSRSKWRAMRRRGLPWAPRLSSTDCSKSSDRYRWVARRRASRRQ